MATLICNATGNLTGASTFAAAETGTSALAMIRANTTTIATATSATSPTFTVTNAKVIDAVLLWVYLSSGTAGTGTFKVDLQKGGVSQASVTVNKSDLPDSTNTVPAPVLFRLTSTATGDGGTNWTVVITTTSGTGSGVVSYSRNSATTADFTRALRTTTAATAAAADDLYIVGEVTGAGAHTSRTVTMDSTAATAYGNGTVNSTSVNGGGIRISNYGTLSYGTSASTNYVLRVNGDLEVYQYATLTIGATGTEIPRTSTAVLEFQMASASGDFGLQVHSNATFNCAGLSRTSGKTVVQCKLTSDVSGASNVLTSGPTTTNGTNTNSGGIDVCGTSLLASTFNDTATNATHSIAYTGPSINNTTQTAKAWLARGSGTNNRYVRLTVGNATVFSSVTNGFYVDIDMQAGTVGTATAIGTGTATSTSITAVGGGYLVKLTGKVASTAATPSVLLNACSASGTTSFAGAANQCFIYEDLVLVTASSISDTTFNVDTDTGWLSGDTVCVAATTRTVAECEDFLLNANAGASSFTTPESAFGIGSGANASASWASSHSGTSPTQAEVGLLTRNVKVRSTSSTLWGYVNYEALATVTASWAEFYYLGSNTANKYGIHVSSGTTTNAKSITYCSMHDMYVGCYAAASGSTSLNLTFSNNVVWNMTSTGALILNAVTNTDWTFDSNLVMKPGAHCYFLGDIGGTFTNNTAVAATAGALGIYIGENTVITAYTPLGTFSGNVAHSCGNQGTQITSSYVSGTISTLSAWRNSGAGMLFNNNTASSQLSFSNPTFFGNGTQNVSMVGGDVLNITGGSISGDASFSTLYGISLPSGSLFQVNIAGVDFSGTGTGLAAHTTADIETALSTPSYIIGTVNNCKFGAGSVAGIGNSTKSALWSNSSYISFEKYNQTSGDHRTEMTYGQLKTDTSIYNTASPSMRMTPNSASSKLESAPKGKGILVAVANGGSVSFSCYVYKSKTGDGALYNGNQPRLIQRANPALGQNSDVVLASYSAGTGSWNQLSGNSSTATDDGCWEFVIDCDGTVGWVNVDDCQAA